MSFIRIFHQYNDMLIIKKSFISKIDKDPIDWINIPALSNRVKLIEPDISSISFLINYKKFGIISEILLAVEKYEECLKTRLFRLSCGEWLKIKAA